ncbi:MAG: MFS transporter [Balneola sp.]|nr:MAG: MFS transporter [Balneola sp.]
MSNSSHKVPFIEKVGYSVGDTASNLFFQTFIVYLLFFYTDVFGISAAAAGTMFLVTRIIDAITDPVMGIISDSTISIYGKFRPYLFWLAIPFGVIGMFMFFTPDLGDTGKIVYAYITYTLMMILYTAINVPYSALMGVITPSSEERTVVSSYRFVAAYVGLLIVTGFTESLVEFFGGGDRQAGWMWTMGLYGLVAAVLFMITFFTTKERVAPPKGQEINIWRDGGDLIKNLPWVLIGLATVFQLMFLVIRGGSFAFYINYYVGDHSIDLFGSAIGLSLSTFLTSGALATLVGALLTSTITKFLDRKKTYSWFLGLGAVVSIFFFFLTPDQIAAIYLVNIIAGFLLGPVAVLQWAMYTDTADYGEWKFGRRATGLIMAASLFALKLGVALGGAITGWVLSAYGFVANQDQSVEALEGIQMLVSIIPAIFGILAFIVIIFYPLTNEKMKEIEVDLIERRGESGEEFIPA